MPKSLKEVVADFKGKKVIVWGDFILDEYIFTTSARVSREAPVLVTEWEGSDYRVGGAGNVVMNLVSLGADPLPVGFIGRDVQGRRLKAIFKKNGIPTGHLIEMGNFRTAIKSRILSGGENTRKQQVLRIDTIHRSGIRKSAYAEAEGILAELLATSDGLIMSDYLAQSVDAAVFGALQRKFDRPLFALDSRNHLLDFPRVTVATPNEPEIRAIFPGNRFFTEEDFLAAGKELLERLQAGGVILKRGHQGMIVFKKGRSPEKIEIHGTTEIVDVTGAGDTVLAVVSLSLISGASLLDSARLANIAAGMVVMKEGASPVLLDEFVHAIV
jgi:D-glycero-beta-D-manno-heptose-7-phosphate kinase